MDASRPGWPQWTGLMVLLSMVVTAGAWGDVVTLRNGDTLTGRVVQWHDEAVVIEHPVLGTLMLEPGQVASVTVEEEVVQAEAAETPAVIAAEPVEAKAPAAVEEAKDHGVFGLGFLKDWERHGEIGITGKQGNAETMDLRVALHGNYEDIEDRWKGKLTYYRSQSRERTTRNEFLGELTRDWLFPDRPWFVFSNVAYEYDQFEAWQHRWSGFGGLGYTFIEGDRWMLRGRAGAGGNYEFGDVQQFTPEGLLGLETELRINGHQKLKAYSTFYPSIEEDITFRNISGASWSIDIDPDRGIALRLGFENEYESEIEPNQKHNDLKYFTTLVFDF